MKNPEEKIDTHTLYLPYALVLAGKMTECPLRIEFGVSGNDDDGSVNIYSIEGNSAGRVYDMGFLTEEESLLFYDIFECILGNKSNWNKEIWW